MGGHSMDGMDMRDTSLLPPDVEVGPGVDMVSMAPVDKTGDPGIGLRDVPHRVLNYRMLAALEPNRDTREPSRLLEIHLTGNMERYIWSMNGNEFWRAQPIVARYGERLRIRFINETMMNHPMHMHGMWMVPDLGHGAFNPRKHVVNVKPGTTLDVDVIVDAEGDWAFHCHLLYHMESGMMRIFRVVRDGAPMAAAPRATPAAAPVAHQH